MDVLIVEDGNEYFEALSRFVPGPRYTQVRNGRDAVAHLQEARADVIYLDMRFDRIPREDLLGDVSATVQRHNGNVERGYRFLANNQGLYILEELRRCGFGTTPVLLAYDFSQELQRLARLQARHPSLTWLPDAISPEEIRARLERLAGESLRAAPP